MLARLSVQPSAAQHSLRALRPLAVVPELQTTSLCLGARRYRASVTATRFSFSRTEGSYASPRRALRRPNGLRLSPDGFERVPSMDQRESDLRLVFLGTAAGGTVTPTRAQSSLVLQLHAVGGPSRPRSTPRLTESRALDVRLRRGHLAAVRVRPASHFDAMTRAGNMGR